MSTDIHSQRILIIDFGSQYTQLIARRVRELGVYCEIQSWRAGIAAIRRFAPRGVILSGGPQSVTGRGAPRVPPALFEMGVPLFGICYGMQTMAVQLGGKVEAAPQREFGYAQARVTASSRLLDGISDHIDADGVAQLEVWMSHGDKVVELPGGFELLAATDSAPIAAMVDEARGFYGVQFHPEVTHTRQGGRILEHFVKTICGCEGLWMPGTIIEDAIATVRRTVGSDKVLLGLSGGVDSSVVAALLSRAIGDQLTCVFVDHGLLRLDEGDHVMEMFARNMGIRVIRVRAEREFLRKLKGVSDPERKRKIIGRTFIEVFERKAAQIRGVKWLAQGTIYPDVIESAASKHGNAQLIKSHHNVGGLPARMKLGLLEPLKELFKDEVRRIGLELGLPHDMVYRHPFPGPGLGVRILGEVRKAYADVLRRADAIFIEELHTAGLYHEVSQAFAVFLPVKSVGVTGDGRRYEWVIALRAVETVDFMTARSARLPWELLERVSRRIINEVPEVSRVTYDVSSKPPATIEWE
ncbi:MAG: glutamine-hydrolyzing GMP synthase [Pseudomonadales bacterium]|jgi:GMP synthase (glutamine-hydrolysing)|nr:glutamine-hydrolyzing GMP synthase [Pseudomonadales bacterium]MCP5320955.1 glutamine-hydrolyzing GMP synthase [Pseudomonadales bacterium]